MNEALIATITSSAVSVESSKRDLKERVKNLEDNEGNKLAMDVVIPGADYTLNEIFTGLASLVGLTENFETKENGPFVPKLILSDLSTRMSELAIQTTAVLGAFQNVTDNGGAKILDPNNFSVTAKNDTAQNFAKHFRSLFTSLDNAFAAWYDVRFVLRAPRLGDFSKYAAEFESHRDAIATTLNSAESVATEIEEKSANLDKLLDQAKSLKDEIARTGQEGQADRRTIAEYAADATNKMASIKAVEERAAGLEATLADYQTDFDAFDEQLGARSKRFEEENAEYVVIRDRLLAQEAEAKRLASESEGLLRGATNVGLASSFSKLQSQIERELTWARLSFYFSIAILIVLSLPIALYVFPGLQLLLRELTGVSPEVVLPKSSIEGHATTDVLAQIAARALLLIPGIWLVRFAGARHERLFRLREHYAYKYSVASSVEGFKKQAPELEQGIAATAFYELTFNPATRMDANSTESRHPNPAMEWVMKKLGGASDSDKVG
jgi:conjugal transfer/entry exclusion protein